MHIPTKVGIKKIINQYDGYNLFFSSQAPQLVDFDQFHGKEINTELAMEIQRLQYKFIREALSTSIYWMTDGTNDPEIRKILSLFHLYYKKVVNGEYIQTPDAFCKEQNNLYEMIHKANIYDTHRLAFEFILGLARFDIALQLIYLFVKYYFKYKLSQSSFDRAYEEFKCSRDDPFFSRLNRISKASIQLMEVITDTTTNFDYWNRVKQYFNEIPTIRQLVNNLVSTQYIPNNLRFLTIAQVLHWNGLGGNADIFNNLKAFHDITKHAIDYHGSNDTIHFSNRLNIFKNALNNVMLYVQQVVTNAVPFLFKETNLIRIYDVCSGPKYKACEDLIRNFPTKYKFQLTLSDINGESLANAFKIKHQKDHPSNMCIEHIYYEDMNLPLPEFSIQPYHIIMAGIGLHQASPSRISDILKNLSMRLVDGGLILNPDVGSDASLQLFLIPANIVDREGSVPAYDSFNLKDLIYESNNNIIARIAYPLHRICRSSSNNSSLSKNTGPYMFNAFIALDINKKYINSILQKWAENKEKCDNFMFLHSESNINVSELQDTMLKNVQQNYIMMPRDFVAKI